MRILAKNECNAVAAGATTPAVMYRGEVWDRGGACSPAAFVKSAAKDAVLGGLMGLATGGPPAAGTGLVTGVILGNVSQGISCIESLIDSYSFDSFFGGNTGFIGGFGGGGGGGFISDTGTAIC
jgi:hypothetical protein